MPRTAAQNEEIKLKRKTEILNVSIKTYARVGYKALRIDMITAEANCSHGLFYHYFKDKRECMLGIYEDYLSSLANLPPVAKANELGGFEGLKVLFAYVDNLFVSPVNEIYAFKIINDLNIEQTAPEVVREWAANYDFVTLLVKLVRQGQAEGHIIAGDAEEICQAMMDVINANLDRATSKNKTVISLDVLTELFIKHPL